MAEEIKVPEKRASAGGEPERFDWDKEKREAMFEKKEMSQQEKDIAAELRREVELMDLDDNLKKVAEQKANTIHGMADDEKLKKLLDFAQEKGVVFAIQTAKKMNDPFLLDALHDLLAKEGYYQKFIK